MTLMALFRVLTTRSPYRLSLRFRRNIWAAEFKMDDQSALLDVSHKPASLTGSGVRIHRLRNQRVGTQWLGIWGQCAGQSVQILTD